MERVCKRVLKHLIYLQTQLKTIHGAVNMTIGKHPATQEEEDVRHLPEELRHDRTSIKQMLKPEDSIGIVLIVSSLVDV